MKNKLIDLLSVKSIVTIILTIAFAYLSVIGEITAEQFLMIFTTVIAFYFGTQHEKKSENLNSNENLNEDLKSKI